MKEEHIQSRILIFDCDEDACATGKNTSFLFKNYIPHAQLTRACEGVFPTQLDFDGYIIGGSSAYVRDAEKPEGTWIRQLIDCVKQIDAQDKPILGVCFGHQILAHTFGGKVESRRSELGLHVVVLEEKDKLFAGLDKEVYVMEAHSDWVTVLPRNAECLAKSNHEELQAFRYRVHYGLQFHPEIQLAFMLGMAARARKQVSDEHKYDERIGRTIIENWYNNVKKMSDKYQ